MITKWFKGKFKSAMKKDPILDAPLDSANTALLLIDIQEKLVNSIPENKLFITNLKKIIDSSILLDISLYLTEQVPEKLGETISDIYPAKDFKKYSKTSFSCIECSDLILELEKNNIKNILICGLESHVCVLQSSLDLMKRNFNVHIISNAMRSRNHIDHDSSIKRLRDSGAIISTVETIVFELCKTSNHKNFKKISQVIKRVD